MANMQYTPIRPNEEEALRKSGWSQEEIDFLKTGPVSSSIKGMAVLGTEQPQYAEMARKQVQQLMQRRVNKTGGFLSNVLESISGLWK